MTDFGPTALPYGRLAPFTEEQLRLRRRAQELAEHAFLPKAHTWDQEGKAPLENLNHLAEEGFLSLSAPARFGGSERPLIDVVLVQEQIARYCFATAELVQMAVNGPAYVIGQWGTPELQERYLPGVLAGQSLIGISVTEEQAGSSLGELSTTGRLVGDRVVVDGRKWFTTGGDICNAFQVLVRFGGDGLTGLGCVVVDASTPGFSVEHTFDKIGGNAVREASLRFNHCEVPVTHILIPGEANSTAGFKQFMTGYNRLRCGIAAMCLGVAQAAIDDIGSFLVSRHQFGGPLADKQGLRWRVAELEAELESARLLTYRAASYRDDFPTLHHTALAKLKASEIAVRAANEAIQLKGSRGIIKEAATERRFREVRGWTIAGGTNEMLLDQIGKEVLARYHASSISR